MSNICMALHGMFPAGKTDTDVAAAFDAAAAAIGLSFESEERSLLTHERGKCHTQLP